MSDEPLDRYEVVIGLEVHTHLLTESKLFSPAPVRYGDPPNHDVHGIDLGLPGVLPVLNEKVIELAIRLGLATHCTVNPRSVFARKNYFYPDLPKGYQISQYEEPIVHGGWIDVKMEEEKGETRTVRVGITRAHLEEDAGKSIHDDAVAGPDRTLIDLNRCGVPLLEVVSEPDLRSAAEAGAYLRALRQLLRYLGVSGGDMEKGQFRCDANVSLRPRGSPELGTRTELKNLNSFRFVEGAIEAEIERQAEILDGGGTVVQCTLAYDPDTHRISVLRVKENASDYRYFPDPDLIPVAIDEAQIERVRASLPELPDVRRERFREAYELSDYEAGLLTESRALADFFEAAAEAHDGTAKTVANWVLRDLLQVLKDRDIEIGGLALRPETLAALLGLVDRGRLTAASARKLFPEIAGSDADPEALMREQGLEAVRDTGLIEGAVDEALAANPQAIEKFRSGDAKVVNFLMGQVMKRMGGKADPNAVRALLARKLEG
ncbi:MAG: Asp-tRNA(Asn)/Glu-tRNA(Gln) amidotransferase subunit GatB [Proteobacteria bacterium]|nr:Asp-tRNA(Asn)/Glu-tRNA(Gln) amidotransferase subunit GatB [Pseudomonadota bacterium]